MSADPPRSALSAQRLHDILQAGIQAPSAENRHYLRFESSGETLALVSSDVHTWAQRPHRRMLALVSYAAVVENMALAAGTYGLAQEVRWFPDPGRIELMACIRWSPDETKVDPLAGAIARRRTNRRFYQRTPLPPAARDRMTDAARPVAGAALRWLDESASRSMALEAMRLAESERFRHSSLHDELFSAIRFDVGWRRSAEEGLPPGALEVEPMLRAPFAALRRWTFMRRLVPLGIHRALGLRAADLPSRWAPQIGFIVGESQDPSLASVAVGRALERVWLAATLEGLAFQPLAAATALAQQSAGNGWVSPRAQARLHALLAHLSGGHAKPPGMFFRVGFARSPSVATDRPPLGRFLPPT